LLELLRVRHGVLMAGRPEMAPGTFKAVGNRAGETVFVAPEDVIGTLAEGFAHYQALESPFARATFMMFLIAEVHPFLDGNGRLARIMMNAELVPEAETRIIIPTIFRGNYLAALKALSLNGHATPLVRTLDFAQRWVAAVPWTNLHETRVILERNRAFMDPHDAEDAGVRLRIPDAMT
jgi:fido (protein-threonine AMPylation protein)